MRRILRYTFALVLIPLLLLAGLEIALRAAGYGYSTSLFINKEHDGREMLVVNEHIARRYLNNPKHRREFRPLPAIIASSKPTNTFRIFVFGESAAQGMCYEHFSFSRMLDAMLNARDDGRRYEVVNCGVDAIDSHVVRQFVEEVCDYTPDLLIIVCGNNELIGPFGPMSVSTRWGSSRGWQTGVRLWLSGLKLSQLAQSAVAAVTPGTPEQEWSNTWVHLRERRQRVLRQDEVTPVLSAYTNNIRQMVTMAEDRGVGVLVCTPVLNLRDFPPFGSAHGADLSADELTEFSNAYVSGVALQRSNKYAEAAVEFQHALDIDGQHAETQYRLAECLYAEGQYHRACPMYASAAMFDSYAARPGVLFSSVLYQLLRQDGIPLCLLDASLGTGLRFGLVTIDRVFDHVHKTVDGHYLAASNIVVRLMDEGLLPAGEDSVRSRQECLERLGWSQWDKAQSDFAVGKFLLRNTLMPAYAEHDRVADAARRRFGPALSDQGWRSNTTLLADAAARCMATLERRPHDVLLLARVADVYSALGGHDIAYGHLQRLKAIHPWYEDIDLRLARAAQAQGLRSYRKGECAAAATWFGRALDHQPGAASYINRAQAYTGLGSNTLALADFGHALEFEPDNALAHNSRGVLFLRMDQPEQAVAACTDAIEAAGDYGPAYANRAAALAQLGRINDARRDVAAARRLGVQVDEGRLFGE